MSADLNRNFITWWIGFFGQKAWPARSPVLSLFGYSLSRHNKDMVTPMARQPLVGHGLRWTSDRLVAETSTWQHTTLATDIHGPGVIRIRNRSMRAAVDPRLGPRNNRDRLMPFLCSGNIASSYIFQNNKTCKHFQLQPCAYIDILVAV
jgi:hypothetical protein